MHAGSAETGMGLEYKKDRSALTRLPLRKNNIGRTKSQIGNNVWVLFSFFPFFSLAFILGVGAGEENLCLAKLNKLRFTIQKLKCLFLSSFP